jgi:hypothetical protein
MAEVFCACPLQAVQKTQKLLLSKLIQLKPQGFQEVLYGPPRPAALQPS